MSGGGNNQTTVFGGQQEPMFRNPQPPGQNTSSYNNNPPINYGSLISNISTVAPHVSAQVSAQNPNNAHLFKARK